MNESITLTKEEIEEITGLVRPSAQQKWLRDRYGIHAEPRGDGTLSVARQLYYQKVGISAQKKTKPKMRFIDVE